MTTDAPTELDWAVRASIYESFATTGRPPAIGALAARHGLTEHRIRTSLERLFSAHEIAPLPNGGGVWMANPFSGIPTDFVVETAEMSCWANCAWDALGVPAITGTDGWIRTHCAQSGDPLEFGIEGGVLTGDQGVIHLLTPIRDAWVDIGFT